MNIIIFILLIAGQFHWKAPGDDSSYGTAYQYSLRWAYTADSLINYWESTHEFNDLPIPQISGSDEYYIVAEGIIPSDTVIYAAIKASDEALQWSDISKILVICCNNPGDANNDNKISILDMVYLMAYLYKRAPAKSCLGESDANGDGITNIVDIVYLTSFLYKQGTPPQCPTSR